MAEQQATIPVTWQQAMDNAARILQNIEAETNLATVETLNRVADTWLTYASILAHESED